MTSLENIDLLGSVFMIIGPDFIWLHFPKTGGTAIELFLSKYFADHNGVHFDEMDPQNVIWHENIRDRATRSAGFSRDGRKVICGIRRLPAWVISRVTYEAQRPPYRVASRAMIERGAFFENDGAISRADSYFQYYLSGGVDTWIRNEFLEEDITSGFGIDINEVRSLLTKENQSVRIQDSGFWFTPEQIERLYESNPIWASHEQRIYGSLDTL